MEIKLAVKKDINDIMNIYEYAKKFMVKSGNPNQWNTSYPQRELLIDDIENEKCYVCVNGKEILGVFVFITEEEPTYKYIENGKWSLNKRYGTIHRLASKRKTKNISKDIFDFCKSKIDYIRADTHKDNKIMQKLLIKNEFKECGIIYIEDGSERIAYEYIKN